MKSRGGNALNHRFSFRQNLFLEDWNDWAENSSRLQVIYFYRGSRITLISSDGTRYVRPFVIFRDCIQKVVQFTEPAVINYGLCGKFRAQWTDRLQNLPSSVLKDYYHFMSVERPIINTSLVLDPPFRYHVTDPTCNRANIRCMDFLRKVSSFQVHKKSNGFLLIFFKAFMTKIFSSCTRKDQNQTTEALLLKFITIILAANLNKGFKRFSAPCKLKWFSDWLWQRKKWWKSITRKLNAEGYPVR